MTTETDKPKTTEVKPAFDSAAFDAMMREVKHAPESERDAVIAKNPQLMADGAKIARRCQREGMPVYARASQRLAENAWWDKLLLAKDVVLGGMAATVVYKGVKLAYFWVKGP